MTRAMAVDLGPRVRVNAIEPAAIHTSMLEAGFDGQPDKLRDLARCHPTETLGEPDEVARIALLLSNGDIGFLQGACINLDGGIGSRLYDLE